MEKVLNDNDSGSCDSSDEENSVSAEKKVGKVLHNECEEMITFKGRVRFTFIHKVVLVREDLPWAIGI